MDDFPTIVGKLGASWQGRGLLGGGGYGAARYEYEGFWSVWILVCRFDGVSGAVRALPLLGFLLSHLSDWGRGKDGIALIIQ